MRFTWDPRTAAKHGVAFEEAVTVFADPLAIIVDDAEYSERALITGLSVAARVLVTVYIEVNHENQSQDEIRLISARLATKHERRRYEEGEDP